MDFYKAFDRLMGHEGGYTNNPDDPGGETNWGISKRAYPNVDIKNLTRDQAKNIYYRDYWQKCHIGELPEAVQFDMFDMAVNSGISAAVKTIQRALGVTADGVWGPNTSRAASSVVDPQRLDKVFSGYRLQYLADLPTWPTFGKGWARRIAANLIGD